MPNRQIFFDPERKRWKRLRRVLDITAVVFTLVLAGFIFNVLRNQRLPELLLPIPKHNYKALTLSDRSSILHSAKVSHPAHRKSGRKPSEIPFNTGEGLRAAYYVTYDEASYSSLKEHIRQIDMLFPEWLHVDAPEATLLAVNSDSHREYPVIEGATVHDPDELNRVKHVIQAAREDTEIFPHLNNFNHNTQSWDAKYGNVLKNPAKRAALCQQILRFFAAYPVYRGLSLDFEDLPDDADSAYLSFVQELYAGLHARNLRLYVNTPVSAEDNDFRTLAANSDGIILMNYDQHQVTGGPGPVASQEWFVGNLTRVLKIVPKDKVICAIGNYGYDWTISLPDPKSRKHSKPRVLYAEDVTVSEAWQRAADADADLDLDYDSLNPHFEYIDEDNHERHVVWFLDGVTLLNEMRAARQLGLQTFALWRLGEEDSSLWSVWDKPTNPYSLQALGQVQPSHDIDDEGDGDIIRVTGLPQQGKRTVSIDTDEPDPRKKLIIDEHMDTYPRTYTVQQYGYHPKQVALSFDDGPDPKWTPKILDILKNKGVKGTFMLIGAEAQENVNLMKRVFREGHEIGNHTYTHPDISEISDRQLDLEIKLTERLFASKLGIQPLYFRPPYDIDAEPDTDDQAAPIVRIQQAGYTIVGNKIDTNDWDEQPRKTPDEIIHSVFDQLEIMQTKPQFRGSIILMHDGGGDRSVTVETLPLLIDALRARGYTIVPVSSLLGKTSAEVMPRIGFWDQLKAIPDSIAFSSAAFITKFIVFVFFLGDVLMSARLILVGLFALIERFRRRRQATSGYNPRVAVLIPAYNEETVIVRTIRSVLNSDYENLHIIVIDDGSTDATAETARQAYAAEISAGRVQVLTKPNGGKAAALNYALDRLTEEIYVGIDADTVIAPDAISKLIPHFQDPSIGAVAGNAKVGNRPAGRPSNTSPARTSSAAPWICSTSSPSSPEPSVPGAPHRSRPPAAIRSIPSPKTLT
jgi:peptidoglycan/xylan/chitin deacetylase (PgdA/CDA1 family)/spore germination protein YaaH